MTSNDLCGVQVVNMPPEASTYQEHIDSEFRYSETLSYLIVSHQEFSHILVKRDLTNAASIVQSSQPKRLFPTARAVKRTATVATERLVRTAQIVIVLAALFWSPSGGGSPLSIRYADILQSDTGDDHEFIILLFCSLLF